jgi:hypothetical protein
MKTNCQLDMENALLRNKLNELVGYLGQAASTKRPLTVKECETITGEIKETLQKADAI